ncbi:unnamed protein product [Ambrosiozyma monospora]|uniref:Unnamed protein product n=1 Tax=Ambrosiozyma monospora TaxID=43982 RepID=A0A9W6Z8S8_AMBMO|nr:unnamed protein product [Ambrosiozyma monospora]
MRMNEKNLPPILINANDKNKLSEPALSASVAKMKQPSVAVTKIKQNVPVTETKQQNVPAPISSAQKLEPVVGTMSKKRLNNPVKSKTHKRKRLRKNIVEEDLEFSD